MRLERAPVAVFSPRRQACHGPRPKAVPAGQPSPAALRPRDGRLLTARQPAWRPLNGQLRGERPRDGKSRDERAWAAALRLARAPLPPPPRGEEDRSADDRKSAPSSQVVSSAPRSHKARARTQGAALWSDYCTFSFTGVPVTRVFVNTGRTGSGISVGDKNANCSTSTAMATIASAPDICETASL